MISLKPPGDNVIIYKAPVDWDEKTMGPCADLYASFDGAILTTIWKPTPDEIFKLVTGGVIVISLVSKSMPPMMVETGSGKTYEKDDERS